VCLVTGASAGIGRATALRLGQAGARVIGVARDRTALEEVAARTGGIAVPADLADPEQVRRCAMDAVAAGGRVDVLVNAAGFGWAGPFVRTPAPTVDGMIAVNLTAPLHLTRTLLPGMLERGRGAVVLVSSIAGHVGVREEAAYAATKAALIAFAESLRQEVSRAGARVGVTVVSPGAVRTAFFARRGRPYDRAFPRQRAPEEVADALVRAVERGRAEVFVPAWLGAVTRLRGAAPSLYRALADRFG
jgi:short-subunit dehydrogenase